MDEIPAISTKTPGQDGRAPVKGRVLAVRGGALGDFILTLPSLRALRKAGYEVELLTRSAYGRLTQEAGMVSGWRSLESPEAASLLVEGAGIDPGWRRWLSGFEAVVSWLPDSDGAFQHQVRKCGITQFHQGDWRCGGSGPAAEQLGGAVTFTGSDIVPMVDLLAAGTPDFSCDRPVIALHPGSGSPRKNWPLARWLTVMESLQTRHPNLAWRIITGEAEAGHLETITEALHRSGLPWESVHGLELPPLAHLLRSCRMLLGHDSGISHLAAACGVPCRILFGPTDAAVWAPLGEAVRALQAPGGKLEELTSSAVLDWLAADATMKQIARSPG